MSNLFWIISFAATVCAPLTSAASQSRPVRGFNGINAGGAFQITVSFNGKESLQLDTAADSKILDQIETIVTDGTLIIRFRSTVQVSDPIIVTISALTLNSIVASGSSRFNILQPLRERNIQLASSGSSVINLSVDTTALTAQLSGSGAVVITGKSNTAQILAQGSTQFKGVQLTVDTVDVSVQGSGLVEINVMSQITGHVSGAGLVRYDGQPRLAVSTSGVGGIQHI